MTDRAFERVTFRGALMDRKTQAFLEQMETRLGYELTVMQGCYQASDGKANDVAQSAGTHDLGGVVDLAPFEADRKVRVARELGAFAWHRRPSEGPWSEHVHLGIRDHGNLAPSAQRQQADYDATPPRNGLASHLVDATFHPSPPVTFVYPVPPPVLTRGARIDALIASTRAALAVVKPGSLRERVLKASLASLLRIPERPKS